MFDELKKSVAWANVDSKVLNAQFTLPSLELTFNKSPEDIIDCSDDCCDDNDSRSVFYRILNYGFVRLPLDIVNPLIIGIILSSLIMILIPANYFEMF